MNKVLTIVSVFPEIFNVNGDAENSAVLAARSRWAGHSARVIRVSQTDPVPAETPGVVIIGSATDVVLPQAITALQKYRPALAEWIAAGVPMVAVGTGWELLAESIELAEGTVQGLGLLPGRAVLAASRISDDLIVNSPFGRLVGYENHARDMILPAGSSALGEVVYGRGNGGRSTVFSEGLLLDNVVATHLHGPVLAKNPALADHVLSAALGEVYDARNVPAGRVDDIARSARNIIATRLGQAAE